MPLPWQHEVPDTNTYLTKLILDKVAKFGSVWMNIEVITFKVSAGTPSPRYGFHGSHPRSQWQTV